MTVPSRVDAAALLLSLDPPPGTCGIRAPSPRCRVPGGPDRSERRGRRPAAGRGGRPAPRRRQGTPRGRPGSRAPPRRRVRGLADAAGAPGARPGRWRTTGHEAARRGALPSMGRVRDARGADRRLRRQARGQRLETMTERFASWRRRYRRSTPGDAGRASASRPADRPGPGRTAGSRRLPRGRDRPGRGPAAGVDRRAFRAARPRGGA